MKTMYVGIILAATLVIAMAASRNASAAPFPERHYQDIFCNYWGGKVEHVLPDRTRVDCLLAEFAVEVDFGDKWAESIGQALYYAAMTHRKPAVLLVIGDDGARFIERFRKASAGLGIRLFVMSQDETGR